MISRTLRAADSEKSVTGRLRSLARIPRGSPVVLGIGDDCAIFRPRGSKEDLLFTSDLYVEDVHFRRETHGPADVAWNAVTRSLSDIAAMGGDPKFALIALCVSPWVNKRWMDRFFDCAVALLENVGAVLAGGDLSHGEKLVCDVMLCGAVERGRALRRDGARPGDQIYVSGALGGSALGLATGKGRAWKRHLRPEARLETGRFLRTLPATAAIDISDGLSLDLQRLCIASGVSADIGEPPVFAGASLDQALHGGEEYELLFTVGRGAKVPLSFGGVPLAAIGTISKGAKGVVKLNGQPLTASGYDHFRSR